MRASVINYFRLLAHVKSLAIALKNARTKTNSTNLSVTAKIKLILQHLLLEQNQTNL